jgi:holo-[acyl-carrier protein] synthase
MRAIESPADALAIGATADAAVGAGLGAAIAEWAGSALGRCAGVAVALGVGVDVVDIRELADMVEASGPSFVDMCWTPAEQASCEGSIPRLAARWAAKEAAMKALGHGIGEVDPIDIEVVSAEGEPPSLQLYGSAAALARTLRVNHLAVSITHEANVAIAFVVALGDGYETATRAETGTGARQGGEGRKCSRGSTESRD